ncbi:MAG TPA: hypothetical protein VEJ86_11150 [Candidatus Binataceae bacterium]|nr:hypothetical protein [Candidatus Binataceae bacterium]
MKGTEMRGLSWRVVAVLLLAVSLTACESKADKMVRDANDLAGKAIQSDPDTRGKLLEQARTELRQAVTLDPNNLNGFKLLAQVDEVTGHTDDAGKDYMAASALDPTDQKLMAKARYYRTIETLVNSSGQALDQIKQGNVDDGMSRLQDILKATRTPESRDKVADVLKQALPIVQQQGDQAAAAGKYPDALKAYEQCLRGYMLLARATDKQTLDPGADPAMNAINDAAQKAKTPDAPLRVFNDLLAFDPDNKNLNMQLAQVYLHMDPPEYDNAADLEERAGAPDADVKKLRDQAKRHQKG